MSFDRNEHGPEWQPVFDAIEKQVGGRIVDGTRQARWRPVFFVVVERPDGERVPICYRGGRSENDTTDAIRHEFDCFSALEKNGILVPHIYGYVEAGDGGIIMEHSPGRHDLSTAESPEEFESVRNDFIRILADIHRLPTKDFEAFGLKRLETARDLALGDSQSSIRRFKKYKTRPEPALEFLIDWTERNIPEDRDECCFLTCDSGQFIFEKGRVTAMLDMELGYLGDPLADLGGLFSRDLTEKTGPIDEMVDVYEKEIGHAVDRRVVLYHAIRFAMTTPLGTALAVATPPRMAEYIQYLTWYLVYQRTPIELIAHREGFALDEPEMPTESESPYAIAHDALQDRFKGFETQGEFQAYEADGLRRLALFLRQGDRYGQDLLERDFDDAAELLGQRPKTWQQRDADLEQLVFDSHGARDAELARYFVRRLKREEWLLKPAMRDLVGVEMQKLAL